MMFQYEWIQKVVTTFSKLTLLRILNMVFIKIDGTNNFRCSSLKLMLPAVINTS